MSSLADAWRHAPTHRKVWALCTPMMLSNLTIPLVALTDTAVAGHLPHVAQLAGVAVGSLFYGVLVNVLGFLRMGTTGFSAQAAGRRDGAMLRQVLLQALLLAVALGSLVALLAPTLFELTLQFFAPTDAMAGEARHYLQIRLLGLPAALIGYALIGWYFGTQNARAALALLLVVNLGNIALDLIFVLGLDWAVAGIARASVVAEWVGVLVGLALLRPLLRRHPGHFSTKALLHWATWCPLLAVNRDLLLRSLLLQGAFLLVTLQGMALGETTVAANALLLNGLALTAYALDGLAHALEALAGHAIGAGDRLALRRALVVSAGWSLLGSLLFALGFGLAGTRFVQLQTDLPTVAAQAEPFLPYLAVLPLVAVWSYLLDGLFIAATRAAPMRNAMALAFAVALAFGLASRDLGNHGLWATLLIFMALRGVCLGWTAWRLRQTFA